MRDGKNEVPTGKQQVTSERGGVVLRLDDRLGEVRGNVINSAETLDDFGVLLARQPGEEVAVGSEHEAAVARAALAPVEGRDIVS